MLQSGNVMEKICIHTLPLQGLQKRAFSAWKTHSSQQEARASNLFARVSRRRSQKQVFNIWATFTVLTTEVVRTLKRFHRNHAIVLDGRFPLPNYFHLNHAIVLDRSVEIPPCSSLLPGTADQG